MLLHPSQAWPIHAPTAEEDGTVPPGLTCTYTYVSVPHLAFTWDSPACDSASNAYHAFRSAPVSHSLAIVWLGGRLLKIIRPTHDGSISQRRIDAQRRLLRAKKEKKSHSLRSLGSCRSPRRRNPSRPHHEPNKWTIIWRRDVVV